MPMSISFEACAHTVRACDDKPRTNFANLLMASLGFLGCGKSESRNQCRRPSLRVSAKTCVSQASTRIAGSVFDLMSKSTFKNSAGNVFIMEGKHNLLTGHVPAGLAKEELQVVRCDT